MVDITGFSVLSTDLNTSNTGGNGITISGRYTGGGGSSSSTNDEDIRLQVQLDDGTWYTLGTPAFGFGGQSTQKTYSLNVTSASTLSVFTNGTGINDNGQATFRFFDVSTNSAVNTSGSATFTGNVTTPGISSLKINTTTSELNPAGGITLKGSFTGGGTSSATNSGDITVQVKAVNGNTWYTLDGNFVWNYSSKSFEFVSTDSDLSRYALGNNVQFKFTDDKGTWWTTSDDVPLNTSPVITLCFYPGTMIATPEGEKAVETLEIGDMVLLQDGSSAPVRWMGRNTISLVFADKLKSLPIRIRKDALAENVPSRDLLVSPDHAILVGGILAQAATLVNGTSIVRETDVPGKFTYHHIELAQHAIVMAENTPAETFVDNVDRMAYDNWAEHEALFGDLPAIEEMDLPRAKSQRQVPAAIRKALADRAVALGYSGVISAVA